MKTEKARQRLEESNALALRENDWAFHKIHKRERRAALEWEIGRTIAGEGQSWLSLPQAIRNKVMDYCNEKAIEEKDLYYFKSIEEITAYNQSHFNQPAQLHLFKIHWHRGKRKIIEQFEKWIVAQKIDSRKVATFYKPNKGGRPNTDGSLVDLAIYRADKAGLNRVQAIDVLRPMLEGFYGNLGSKVGASHWRANCNRIKRKINRRNGFSIVSLLNRSCPW